MYLPLSSPVGLVSITQYLQDGSLSEEKVAEMLQNGRGGVEWCEAVDASFACIEVLIQVMKMTANTSMVMMKNIIDSLQKTVDRLSPIFVNKEDADDNFAEYEENDEDYANDSFEPWATTVPREKRNEKRATGRLLRERYENLSHLYKAGKHAEKEKKEAAFRKELISNDAKFSARANDGRFLDDRKHDRDFLQIGVVPTPQELLVKGPSLLPENLVLPHRKLMARVTEDNLDDEEDVSNNYYQNAGKDLPIPTKFQYRDFDHYLNTHFLLLREDCLAELRRGIGAFRERLYKADGDMPAVIPAPDTAAIIDAAKLMSRNDNARCNVYMNVQVISLETTRQGLGFVVMFTIPGNPKVDWDHSSRFMTGSLLCLSSDGSFNASTMVVATVMRGVPRSKDGQSTYQSRGPTISISIDPQSFSQFSKSKTYVMIESPVFFEAYRPVLKSLQDLSSRDIPFAELLLGHTTTVDVPAYIIEQQASSYSSSSSSSYQTASGWDLSEVFPSYPKSRLGAQIWNPMSDHRKLPRMPYFASDPPLDDSQRAAIALALSKRLAIIQGPPGCGKTFVGVLITRILLANRDLRSPTPIIFVCQTNHALDQILEHVHKFEKNIIRIGGRSESEIMKSISLQNAQQNTERNMRRNHMEMQARDKLTILLRKVKADIAQMSVSSSTKGTPTIADCSLARLRRFMADLGQRELIDDIVKSASYAIQKAIFESIKSSLKSRKSKGNPNDVPDWSVSFDKWDRLTPYKKIIIMSAFVNDSAPSHLILDAWIAAKVNKSNSNSKAAPQPTKSKTPNSQPLVDQRNIFQPSKRPYVYDSDDDMEIDDDVEDRNLDEELGDGIDFSDLQANGLDRDQVVAERVADRVTPPKAVVEVLPGFTPALKTLLKDNKDDVVIDESTLSKAQRLALVNLWSQMLALDVEDGGGNSMADYQQAVKDDAKYFARVDAETLRGAAVVGMTTTGAAKYGATLRALKSEIVIAEEAAEVVEAHILASLTPSTKHLILIGDHQQLRPQINEYALAKRHHLEISLFERLINSGLPHVKLTTQRRMHPEISSLITPSIYSSLIDDPSVLLHEPVRGVQKRVYFIDHEHMEDSDAKPKGDKRPVAVTDSAESGGKSNTHEAMMLLCLAQHLLYNGYRSNQIVILSMYKKQLRLLKKEAKAMSSRSLTEHTLDQIRMTTTDNYQGEECDVVLLSLVRSNKEGKAGFVKEANRICVALSRARDGLYVIGNFKMIRAESELWNQVCTLVESREQLGPGLALICPNHSDAPVVEAQTPEDFRQCPNGGCLRKCNGLFPGCEHRCELLCHPVPHKLLKCNHICEKSRPTGCSHKCPKPCWQDCGPCQVPVDKQRSSCGHTLRLKCCEDVDEARCRHPCPVSMLCGHSCEDECSHNHTPQYNCRQACSKTRATCSHPCKKKCFESCGPCEELVTYALPCGHQQIVKCSFDRTLLICKEKCAKRLACDHPCTKLCSEVCDVLCEVKVKRVHPKCRMTAPHSMETKCGLPDTELPCQDKCRQVLPCGHMCKGLCCDCSPADGGPPYVSRHVECKELCNLKLPCNHRCGRKHRCGTACPPAINLVNSNVLIKDVS